MESIRIQKYGVPITCYKKMSNNLLFQSEYIYRSEIFIDFLSEIELFRLLISLTK